jgi:hypothetical protein
MGKVLTTSSSVKCIHQGTVVLTTDQSVLKVNGKPVLVEKVQGSFTSGSCTQVPPPASNVPCTIVQSQSGGTSNVLKVNGKAVVLDNATGKTNGQPTNDWSVNSAEQQVLQAT